jgi:diguanylate cyclase (GGDEF)-like protein/PAS domain S-box-containing protein
MRISNKKIENRECERENSLESVEIYKLIVENTVECIWLFDLANMCFKYISPSIIDLRGVTANEAMKGKLKDSLTPESLEKISIIINGKRIQEFLEGGRSSEILYSIDEFQQYCKDGKIKTIEISTKLIFNEKTNYVDILGVSRDLTERKKFELRLKNEIHEKNEVIKNLRESEKKLSRLTKELLEKNKHLKNIAITDKLTNLYNRYFFDKKIIEKIEETNSSNNPLTLILLDIDQFKRVNDICGHDAGDKILIKVADIGIKLISKYDIFARWGGDEFAILGTQIDIGGGSKLAENLCQSIMSNLYLDMGQITASIGVAERRKSESFECWFKRADKALYKAKNNGGNCVIIS